MTLRYHELARSVTLLISRNAAKVNSQGRKPLEYD